MTSPNKNIKVDFRYRHFERSQELAKVGSYELAACPGDLFATVPVYWSDEIYRIFGYEPGNIELTNELFFRKMPPEDIELWVTAINSALYGTGILNVKHRLVMDDNSMKHVWHKGEVVFDELTREPLRVIGTMQDITILKTAEEQLQRTNEELNMLFETMGEVFFSVDMKAARLIQISKACEIVYGYSAEEFKQNSNLWYEVVLDEDKPLIDSNYILMYSGQPFTGIYRIQHKNGSTRWVETKISPTLSKDGTLKRVDGITSDITIRKEYEDALKASNEELNRFVYTVTHDLRAPLSSIIALTGFCEEENDIEIIREYLALVKGSSLKLDSFITDILNYARNTRSEVEIMKFNIKELVDEIADTLRFMDQIDNVGIKVNVPGDMYMYSDADRIKIILSNLISNSLRYHNPDISDPYVEIGAIASGDGIQFKVADNGIGIAQENQHKVFDMFYRISRKSTGSGLGLYIVKETVEKLGGVLQLSSEADAGTSVIITVPNAIPPL